MKYSKLFLVLILICVVACGVYISFETFLSRSKEGDGATVFPKVRVDNCFLLLGSFDKYQSDYSTDELAGLSVDSIVSSDDLGEIGGLFSTIEYIESLDTFERPVIAPIEASSIQYKTLSIDGQYFWSLEDLSEYPLCSTSYFEYRSDEEKDTITHNLYENDGVYYTFDYSSVKSIYAAGEIIPVRAVDRTWLDQSDNYSLLFDRYVDVIKNSDLSLAMLENPLAYDPEPCRGCMLFVGDERNVQAFKDVGFDALGIGNHFGDGGKTALERTIEVFADVGLGLAGVSDENIEEASKPVYLEFDDKTVAFLSADDVAAYYWAGEGYYGSNRYSLKSSSGGIGTVDHKKIQADIEYAKSKADMVVVMVSWGVEYTNEANAHQKEMAHSLIDAGADVIIGSHPHWVQQIEIYNEKPIFYSLGNFVFDQTNDGSDAHWSRTDGETRQGMSVQLFYFGDELVSMNLIMHKMCGYDQAGGESRNLVHNLAWKIDSGEMTYDQVDEYSEQEGCVWYQPTPVQDEDSPVFKAIWDRLMEFSLIN